MRRAFPRSTRHVCLIFQFVTIAEHALLEHAGKDGTKAYRIVYNHEYAENKAMLASFKRGHVNESSGGGGLDAMDEVAMMHADLPGHGTQAGPPHALVIVLGTAACALLVRWLV